MRGGAPIAAVALAACGAGGAGGGPTLEVTVDADGAAFVAHADEDGVFTLVHPSDDGLYRFATEGRYALARVCEADSYANGRVFLAYASVDERTEWTLRCTRRYGEGYRVRVINADATPFDVWLGDDEQRGASEYTFFAAPGTNPLAALDAPPTHIVRRDVDVGGDLTVTVDLDEGAALVDTPVFVDGVATSRPAYLVFDGDTRWGQLSDQYDDTPWFRIGESANGAMLAPSSALGASDRQLVLADRGAAWAQATLDHDVDRIDLEIRDAPAVTREIDNRGLVVTFSPWPVGRVTLHAGAETPRAYIDYEMEMLPGWFEEPGADATEVVFPDLDGTPGWNPNWSAFRIADWALWVEAPLDDVYSIGFTAFSPR